MALETLLLFLIAIGFVVFKLNGRLNRSVARRKNTVLRPVRRKPDRRAFNAKTATGVESGKTLVGHASIVDGDTLVVQRTQIRLFGIDAPEIDHPFGQKAKWALVSLSKGGPVRAEISEQDHFGRTVARCYSHDGKDLSAEMVRIGLAIDWPKFSGGQYRALEVADARKKMWLADARQKGRMHVWAQYEARKKSGGPSN